MLFKEQDTFLARLPQRCEPAESLSEGEDIAERPGENLLDGKQDLAGPASEGPGADVLAQVRGPLYIGGTRIEDPYCARILIVDDQRVNLRLLEGILVGAGYSNVHATADAASVVSLCQRIRPDLMLLDLHMPVLNGFQIMELIQGASGIEPFPIVMLTADTNVEMRRAALQIGAMDFLARPFDPIEVTLRARNLIVTHFLRRKLEDHARLLAEKYFRTNTLLNDSGREKEASEA